MKRNKTIIEEVKKEEWNHLFLKAIDEGRLTGETSYWVEKVEKMMNNALNKLRVEYKK